jgi:hypothetical protein
MSCLDSLEEPIFQKQIPTALNAFGRFSATRRYLAEQADIINAKGIEQAAKLRSSIAEAVAVLKAHEPRFADNNSTLSREIAAAGLASVCKKATDTESAVCVHSIIRPIWERNAPETITYVDEFHRKRLLFAREFDASGAKESAKRAADYFRPQIKQALAEFRENAQRDIQAANARDAAARAKDLETFGNILAGVAMVTLAVAEAKAAAAPQAQTVYVNASPTHCTSQHVYNTTYTDCY